MRGDHPGATGGRVDVCQFDGADVLPTLPLAAGWLRAAYAETGATAVVETPEPIVA